MPALLLRNNSVPASRTYTKELRTACLRTFRGPAGDFSRQRLSLIRLANYGCGAAVCIEVRSCQWKYFSSALSQDVLINEQVRCPLRTRRNWEAMQGMDSYTQASIGA